MSLGGLHPLVIPFFAANLALAFLYSSFTAEDAFIVYRYAENLIDGHGLVFNLGERIDALTSPLHALLCALSYAVTGATLTANKALAVLAVTGACAVALALRRYPPSHQIVFGTLVLLSPFVVLWTVGGLETPFLLAWMTLATVLAGSCVARRSVRWDLAFSLVLGLAFLTRFDSVVVTVPLFAAVGWRRLRHAGPRVLPGLVLPGLALALGWLGFAQLYFGDFLPTSFHHKTPSAEHLEHNIIYVGQVLVVTGALPLALAVAWSTRRRAASPVDPDTRAVTVGALVGLAALLLYGLATATTHMMFGYRLFVPYLPTTVLVLLDLAARGAPRAKWRLAWMLSIATAGLSQTLLAMTVELLSVNPGFAGEYRTLSRQGYVEFMRLLDLQADLIGRHWKRHGDPHRGPRIFVYAAGVVPYQLRDAHVLDNGLVSFRRAFHGNELVPPLPQSADYVMTLSPLLGPVERQLMYEPERFQSLSDIVLDFDGTDVHFEVHHNPRPTGWRLPRQIDGPGDFRHAKLAGRELGALRLRDADLSQADLEKADLAGSDLRGARLRGVNLRQAQLEGVELAGADLRGADLRGASGLSQADLNRACGDSRTALPPGLSIPSCATEARTR